MSGNSRGRSFGVLLAFGSLLLLTGCPIQPVGDLMDSDGDGIADAADVCAGFDDNVDTDGDGVPDGCDVCPNGDDTTDSDGDGVADGCDACEGFDDGPDVDDDGVPDGCDACEGSDDNEDGDGDGIADGCDACEGFDDGNDEDGNGTPDGCDTTTTQSRRDLESFATFASTGDVIDLSDLRVGDVITLIVPVDEPLTRQVVVCSCQWTVSPSEFGSFESPDSCTTQFTVEKSGAGVAGVRQTCGSQSVELLNGLLSFADEVEDDEGGAGSFIAGIPVAGITVSPGVAVSEGTVVQLDARPNSVGSGYLWSQVSGPQIELGFPDDPALVSDDLSTPPTFAGIDSPSNLPVVRFLAPEVNECDPGATVVILIGLSITSDETGSPLPESGQPTDMLEIEVINTTPNCSSPPGGGGPGGNGPGPGNGECSINDDCAAPTPFCVANTCVECRLDADCGGNVCAPSVCNAGTCLDLAQLPDGALCDDGNFCNGLDACSAGTCQSSGDPCTAFGLACFDDNPNASFGAEACLGPCAGGVCADLGACMSGAPVCDGNDTCVYAPTLATGDACGSNTDTACDNPDVCDGFGGCSANFELSGTACGSAADTVCDNPDTCDGTGNCMINNEANGATCGSSADTACDDPDTCQSGVCLSNLESAGTACDDNLFCNGGDTCDGAGGCTVHANNACNAGEQCDENQDFCFVGNLISGTIFDFGGSAGGTGFSGFPITLSGTVPDGPDPDNNPDLFSVTTTSAADGSYTADVPDGFSGTATTGVNNRFVAEPGIAGPSYANVLADIANENYTGFRNLYVDDDGSAQPGFATGDPLGTMNNPYPSLQPAADATIPGDTVFVRAGNYVSPSSNVFLSSPLNIQVSGTATARIRYQNFNDEVVILNGFDGVNFHRRCIAMQNQQFVEVSGFILKNAAREGFLILSSSNVLVENCIADECGLNVGSAAESEGFKFDQSTNFIMRKSVARFCYAGIDSKGASDGLIEDCLVHNNGQLRSGAPIFPDNADGIHLSPAQVGSDRITVRRCVAFANTDDGFDGSHSKDCLFDSCYAFNGNIQGFPDGDGGGFKVGNHVATDPLRFCLRLLVRNSIAFNNGFEGIGNRSAPINVFQNCSTFSNATDGIRPAQTTLNCVASGNAANDMTLPFPAGSGRFSNNFVGDGGQGCADCLFGDPLYTNPSGVIDTSWQGGFAEDDVRGIMPTLLNIRAQIQANFALQSGSTAIDAGGFITATTTLGVSTSVVQVNDDPTVRFRVGDVIQIEDATGGTDPGRAAIVSMTSNSITLGETLTFDAGKGVHLPWNGTAPDIGAFESP